MRGLASLEKVTLYKSQERFFFCVLTLGAKHVPDKSHGVVHPQGAVVLMDSPIPTGPLVLERGTHQVSRRLYGWRQLMENTAIKGSYNFISELRR